jgi:probable rRNA maturation factor
MDTPMKSVLFNNAQDVNTPSLDQFKLWVETVFNHFNKQHQVSIEIVDEATSQQLNNDYRGKDKPTNVLSFPLELPDYIDEPLLGDLAICAEVVKREAIEQHKKEVDHWTHLTIHGTLHLLGYDHIEDDEAEIMEALEVQLLKDLGIENPYED